MLRFRNVVEVPPSSFTPVVVLSAAANEVLSIASTLIAPLNRFRPAIRTREAILTPLPSEPGLVQREAVWPLSTAPASSTPPTCTEATVEVCEFGTTESARFDAAVGPELIVVPRALIWVPPDEPW